MKRLLLSCALVLPLVALTAGPAQAEVKSRSRSQIKFEGMLGRMMGMFGGKAAKEGVVATTAVKGSRMATMNDSTAQIIDLSEEKIYELDLKKKTYEVITFEELRRKMREAREKAQQEADKSPERTEKPEPGGKGKEVEVDYEAKETGQKKQIAGYEAREVISTVVVREKGKTLDDGGGLVLTSDSWIGPEIPALKELAEFRLKYFKQLQGPDSSVVPAEQMATITAMYPMVKQAMDRLEKEGPRLKGTPLATTTTFDAVKSKAQMEQAAQNSSSGGGGGLGGLLAKKMMKKEGDAKARSTIFTVDHEVLEVAPSVGAGDVDLPAGFKEKK